MNAQLLLFPSALRQDYRFGYIPLLESALDSRLIVTVIFCLSFILFGVTLIIKKNSQYSHSARFAVSLLALFYLPSSNLLVQVGFVVAERVLYIPSMGYCLLVGIGAAQLIKYRHRILAPLAKFGIGFLIISFSVKTVHRSGVWNSGMGLYIEALKLYRNDSLMLSNLAYEFLGIGNMDLAERVELFSIATDPTYVQPYRNYGSLLQKLHRYQEAEEVSSCSQ